MKIYSKLLPFMALSMLTALPVLIVAVSTTITVGGAEHLIDYTTRKVELAERVQTLANKGTEFAFSSKEEVDAFMRCTACSRAVSSLNKHVIGRLSLLDKSGMRRPLGETEEELAEIVGNVCSVPHIAKDSAIHEGCEDMLSRYMDDFTATFLARCDPDKEEFEEEVDATLFCHATTNACEKGAKSLEEVLAEQLIKEDEEKRNRRIEEIKLQDELDKQKREQKRQRKAQRKKKSRKSRKGRKGGRGKPEL